jgi:predicted ATPase with chaperone activity
MKTLLEEVVGSEVEKRALEVSLSGGHSMVILYNTGSFAPMLMGVGRRMALEAGIPFWGEAIPWCPCGNFGSHLKECTCTEQELKKKWGKLRKMKGEFAIWVGGTIPLAREYTRHGELESIVMKRVLAVREAKEPEDILDTYSRALVAHFQNSYSSEFDVEGMKAVARTIARMDGQEKVQVQHVAEALQYQSNSLLRPVSGYGRYFI